jgi:uncharacterized protein YhaN
VQKALEKEAEELFLPRGSKPRVNAALTELEDLRRQLREAALPSSEWVAHDQALREANARKDRVERELEEAEREQGRLRRVAEAVEPVARRKAVLDELETLADVPRLSPDFARRRLEANSFLIPNVRSEAEARRQVEELTREIEAVRVPTALLEQAEAIEALSVRLGGYRRDAEQRAALEVELARIEAEARAILRDLGRDPDTASYAFSFAYEGESETGQGGPLDDLRVVASQRAAVHELANARQALAQACDEARRAVEAQAERRAEVIARLDALGPERDPGPLRKAAQKALALGDVEGKLREAREALQRDEARAAAALAGLGPWTGPLDTAEALPVPSPEAVDRFGDESRDVDAEAADLRRQLDERDAQARQVDARLEQLRLQGDVPTEDALADARRRRDDAWHALRDARAWDDAKAAAFEQAVRDADGTADRLRREADRVAERAGCLAERSRLSAELDSLRRKLERVEARQAAAAERWSALWAPAGIADPAPPREMLAWLRRHEAVAGLARSVREGRRAVEALEAQIDEHRRALSEALATAGAPSATPTEALADLAARAAEASQAIAEAAAERRRLRDERDALDRARPALEQAAARAEADRRSWQDRWASAMARLNLPADAPSAAALAVLTGSDELFKRLDLVRSHRVQIAQIERQAARFAADVRALAERVAPDLLGKGPDDSPEPVAAALSRRLTSARHDEQRLANLVARRDEQEQAARAARAEVEQARATLAELRREARCATDDELADVEARALRRQQLEKERADLDAALRKLAAGAPTAAFVAEVEQADPDALTPRLARLSDRTAVLKRELEQVNQAIGREANELGRMKGGSDAADIKQRESDWQARVKGDAEQYARLRLAAAVLRAGVERYRQKAQNPVLARAGDLFAALTLGSFAGLRVDFDDRDEPVLRGVRPGGEALGVEAMSLGTADQLYLSLRLATLSDYLDRHEPLPLVVDDVLIQFDDARAAATLKALAEFSGRAQVLVFTHHEHLVRLAEACVDREVLLTHTLPGRQPLG